VSSGHNIFLIGPTGSGKTTIGKLLAIQAHKSFYDVDAQIEKLTGVDIPWIFDVEGEQGFRERESSMIDELSQQADVILATGAGAVLMEDNRRFLSSRGVVVYLKASIEEQLERTHDDKRRPLLQGDEVSETLTKMREQRTPYYENLADYVFDTDGRTAKVVAQEIIQHLKDAALF